VVVARTLLRTVVSDRTPSGTAATKTVSDRQPDRECAGLTFSSCVMERLNELKRYAESLDLDDSPHTDKELQPRSRQGVTNRKLKDRVDRPPTSSSRPAKKARRAQTEASAPETWLSPQLESSQYQLLVDNSEVYFTRMGPREFIAEVRNTLSESIRASLRPFMLSTILTA
jgi:hypothetical protein